MELGTIAAIVGVVLLLPLGAYLRQRTYYYSRHPNEIPSLWEPLLWTWRKFQGWRTKRK